MNSTTIRNNLANLLRLDLVGPGPDDPNADEALPESPTRWYLAGFLVPSGAPAAHRADDTDDEDIDAADDSKGVEDATVPEAGSKRKAFFPSSIGISVLVPAAVHNLSVTIAWGEYTPPPDAAPSDPHAEPDPKDAPRRPTRIWQREQRVEHVSLALPTDHRPVSPKVPNSDGLVLHCVQRRLKEDLNGAHRVPAGTRSVSVFLVNQRRSGKDRDVGTVFQASLHLKSDAGFVARPDMRGAGGEDMDERTAALQYREVCEYAVGHSVATHAHVHDDKCLEVETAWVPEYDVARVIPGKSDGVELDMEVLANVESPPQLQAMLAELPTAYRDWIEIQRQMPIEPAQLRATADELLQRAEYACQRIAGGIELLSDATVFDAFRKANAAMAAAARKRRTLEAPKWRLFQLAFILLNLRSIAMPSDPDRDTVELLFFPTGGGKTEAYLGLAAFTLVLRRLRSDGVNGAGVSVIMRYTLRLLTLDQLGRAAALICALELMREKDARLGTWPFEIGLWVGLAATPNKMGGKGDNDERSAREKVLQYQRDEHRYPAPIPLQECPWCGHRFTKYSFNLLPNPDRPVDLRITCANAACEFTRNRPLPIVAVDEPLYRRLPCFLIATVDKFAALPWVGATAGLFGKVQRYVDRRGFFGPCDDATVGVRLANGCLLPPDLIIQDELHLISGPLGTIAGLYEVAIEALATRHDGNAAIKPKIVASTATIRRAPAQVRALFGRSEVQIFPPPGPNTADVFFAKTVPTTETPGRRYVGIAAPGRSAKVVLLRTYVTLLSAAQAAWQTEGRRSQGNAADPYMTLLGYFNSLRELGGSLRIVEDEVRSRLHHYEERSRTGALTGAFANRGIERDVFELTSRVSTAKVSEARTRLARSFENADAVHVALATNMISVGLDILRLGLMVVLGQPKTTAEYIQATSRVGRDIDKPGLVVTLFNVYRPRDRSHYERFEAYHQSFYRAVEVTSVTPFSPRAIDRILPAVTVALARLGHQQLTAPFDAIKMVDQHGHMQFVIDALVHRLEAQSHADANERILARNRLRGQIQNLLEAWAHIADDKQQASGPLEYAREISTGSHLLHDPLSSELRDLSARERRFVAPRSMRNVEPAIDVWVTRLDGEVMDEEGQ